MVHEKTIQRNEVECNPFILNMVHEKTTQRNEVPWAQSHLNRAETKASSIGAHEIWLGLWP
jgi:hypothetical protein